jgi:MscS family membrane protein
MKRSSGVGFMPSHRSFLSLALSVLFAGTAVAYGQIPGLTPAASTPAPAPSSAVPVDPLGRETPRGTVLGFIKAAQDERYAFATQYFQPSPKRRRNSPEEDEDLVNQLVAILNQKIAGPLDLISRDPLGRLDDGLPPDQEKLNGTLTGNDPNPIILLRLEDDQGRKLWYFSRATLDRVPEMFESLQFPEFEKKIPKALVDHRILAMPLWQWLAILVAMPLFLAVGRLITLLMEWLEFRWRKARSLPFMQRESPFALGPVALAIGLLLHFWFVSYIGTSLLYRIYYRRIIWILLAVAFYWILTRVTRALSLRIGQSLTSRGMLAERSIVSLVRRFVEVTIFLLVLLAVLHTLGFDVTTALAGLGIGGLALGLGAQKTFENMFGGVSVLFDKVVQIGDTCKINNQAGVVEDIGLRSTRLRTAERTLLSIPNGIMATVTIENLRFRDKFLCQQTIRLRYDLSPDHVRYVLGAIRELLEKDPKVEDSTARVRFLRFAEYCIEVEIHCYILEHEYTAYLATQEALLLQVMETVESAGAVIALPTQATIVTQDSWTDPEKSKAARTAIEKIRNPGVPGAEKPPLGT